MKSMEYLRAGHCCRALALAGLLVGGCGSSSVVATAADPSTAATTDSAISVPSATPDASAKGIKYHPGHYIELDPGSGGGGLGGWLKTIASLKDAKGVTGVMLIQPWANLEFAQSVYSKGAGTSALGFAMIDQLLAACHSAGLQFILGVEDRAFGAARTYGEPSSFGQLPPYFDALNTATGAPAYVDAPSGSTWTGSLQMIAKLWDQAVMSRYIRLTQVYGARYDANPNFEMWATSETAIGTPNGDGGFDYQAYVEQLQRWIPIARAAFPTTGLRISANYLQNPAQLAALFDTARPYAIGIGGPDVKIPLTPPFSGTSNLVFNGYEGGQDYRGVLPWISEVQTPDESGIYTIAEIYDYAMHGTLALGGGMHSNYFVWGFDAGYMGPKAFTNAQILAFIAAVGGAVNSTKPSTYLGR